MRFRVDARSEPANGRRRPSVLLRRAAASLLVGVVLFGSGLGVALLPSSAVAQAADVPLLAGPGPEYAVLTTAPSGAPLSADGEAVNGYYPVTYNGISGWAPAGLLGAPAAEQAPAATVDGVPVDAAVAEPPPAAAPPAEAAPAPVEPAPSGDGAGDPAPPVGSAAAPSANASYSEEEIVKIITEAARAYGQNPNAMVRVARCESGLNPNAVGGQYYGLFQFLPSTFAATPYGDGDIFDPVANANAAAWMWQQGRKGEWVCQ